MIGEKVSYLNEYDEKVTGEVTDISSDRFDDVKWLVMGDGEMARPCGPGLGVEVDESQVKSFLPEMKE